MRRAFTLLELLVVIGLIAGLSLGLFLGLQGGGQSASLQAGQATVANLVTSARLKAAATGRHCRLLVGNDPADAARYLSTLVLQLARTPGANPGQWDSVQTVSLPAGIFVLPPEGISLDAVEEDLIRQALEMAVGNKTQAARLLGLSRATLLYRIDKYAILADEPENADIEQDE